MHGFVDSEDVEFIRIYIIDCKTDLIFMFEQKTTIFCGNWDTGVVSMLHKRELLAGDAMGDILHLAYSFASQCDYSDN